MQPTYLYVRSFCQIVDAHVSVLICFSFCEYTRSFSFYLFLIDVLYEHNLVLEVRETLQSLPLLKSFRYSADITCWGNCDLNLVTDQYTNKVFVKPSSEISSHLSSVRELNSKPERWKSFYYYSVFFSIHSLDFLLKE